MSLAGTPRLNGLIVYTRLGGLIVYNRLSLGAYYTAGLVVPSRGPGVLFFLFVIISFVCILCLHTSFSVFIYNNSKVALLNYVQTEV